MFGDGVGRPIAASTKNIPKVCASCILIFMQMGKENQPRQTLAIPVVKERKARMLVATVAPSKSTGRFVTERVNAFIKELGIEHLDVVAKSDQEPAIKKVFEAVGRHRGEGAGRWITEFSPVGKSASNGVVE